MLNTGRPLFASRALRRAANYAIDRRALARVWRRYWHGGPEVGGSATSRYLPTALPGSSTINPYPVAGPDLVKARALARGRSGTAVLYAWDTTPCPQLAQVIRSNLKAIGISVVVKAMRFRNSRSSA